VVGGARPAGVGPQGVEAPVGGDLVQPGADRRAPLEPGQAAPGRQQRLLQDVLGVLHRTEDAVAVHPKLVAVRLGQRPERLAVAGARPRQQILGHRHVHAGIDTAGGRN
jgi:hypothetical protein